MNNNLFTEEELEEVSSQRKVYTNTDMELSTLMSREDMEGVVIKKQIEPEEKEFRYAKW